MTPNPSTQLSGLTTSAVEQSFQSSSNARYICLEASIYLPKSVKQYISSPSFVARPSPRACELRPANHEPAFAHTLEHPPYERPWICISSVTEPISSARCLLMTMGALLAVYTGRRCIFPSYPPTAGASNDRVHQGCVQGMLQRGTMIGTLSTLLQPCLHTMTHEAWELLRYNPELTRRGKIVEVQKGPGAWFC